jgi:hypothetical protein
MSLQPFVPWIIVTALVSVAAMVWAAGSGDGRTFALAAGGYCAVLLLVAVLVNRPYWQASSDETEERAAVLWAPRRNARLFMFAYAWGAAALAAVYSLTMLSWRHDWQYMLAMVIAATLCFSFAELLVRPGSLLAREGVLRWAAIVTSVQGLGAAGGALYVVLSGKLWTYRADWAANQVFVLGGALLAALSLIAMITYARTRRRT